MTDEASVGVVWWGPFTNAEVHELHVESFEMATAAGVMVLADDDTLAGRTQEHPDGARRAAETQGGTPLLAETIRRIACDTGIIPIVLGGQ